MLKGSEYLQRNFRREAAVLQKISHPNVVKLYEVLETDNHYYLIMELARGGELMKHISAVHTLWEEEARKFLRQIVSAVDYMHKAGILHRLVEQVLYGINAGIRPSCYFQFMANLTFYWAKHISLNHLKTRIPLLLGKGIGLRSSHAVNLELWVYTLGRLLAIYTPGNLHETI